MLLRARAAADAADGCGVTPLHAASAHGSAECAALLLAEGADSNACLEIGGRLQLSAAEHELHAKAPLYLAAEKGHAAVVKLLLDAGADAHAPAVTTTGTA
eukprot:4399997-Prymnesium_polylepis.1